MEKEELNMESENEFHFHDLTPIRKRKRDTLYRLDKWAEKHKIKGLWQFVKFNMVGGITFFIQLGLMFLLTHICYKLKPSPLPDLIKNFLSEEMIGKENATWNYLIPFLITGITINTIGYFLNRRLTFRSDASFYQFVFFLVFIIVLMIFCIWFAAFVSPFFISFGIDKALASTIGSILAGFVQTIVLFPVQKFVILKEKKNKDLI